MRRQLECDVLIAGAGPAGASAAIHLCRAGLSVILVDSCTFPRDKVCGDFVSPVALHQLDVLGVKYSSSAHKANVIRKAAVYLDGRHLITNPLPQISGLPTRAKVIPRRILDESIVARARAIGAHIMEGWRVTSYSVQPRNVNVSLRCSSGVQHLKARVLIGADGSVSQIARLLRRNTIPAEDRVIAVRGYFEGLQGPYDQADLYFSSEGFPGYYWLFPAGKDTANVGLGMLLRTLPPNKEHLRNLLLRRIQKDKALRDRLSGAQPLANIVGWPLTTYDSRIPIVGNRVLLIGDAAGLINPLNGEGIQYAILSAGWAAETLEECAAANSFSRKSLSPYARRVAMELEPDMAVARLIVELIRNRSLNPLWLRGLTIITARARKDPNYALMVGGVLSGLIPARSLISPGIVEKTLLEAAVSVGGQVARDLLQGPKHLIDNVRIAPAELLAGVRENHAAAVKWGVDLASNAITLVRTRRTNFLDTLARKRGSAPR